MTNDPQLHVAIIGAGPAGFFAAQKLASSGFGVALFNRDIKPGGLVEYGIFLEKFKLKNGLRSQFQQVLALDNVNYFGNVTIGKSGYVSIPDLVQWGFSAVLVACGAQGTKFINLPGETLQGVYHAKDLVYHYNQLPPFSTQTFKIGKKVVIVGAGNVMTDIAHYLINYRQVEEVTVIIRRGPAEVKFDQKELLPIIAYLDLEDFEKEFKRVTPMMTALGQDVEEAKHRILVALEKECPRERSVKLRLRFLLSPYEILADPNGAVASIKLEHNTLEAMENTVIARGLGEFSRLDVDTVIFAIGDRVNDDLGLPMENYELCKARQPKFPVENTTFEIGDPQTGQPIPGIFYAGWARNPSTGLAGIARRDGVYAATAISEFLVSKDKLNGGNMSAVRQHLDELKIVYVEKGRLERLEEEEKRQAANRGVEEYKFPTNEEMLKAMGLPVAD
jgi:ferredoxin--NADP+ reductase